MDGRRRMYKMERMRTGRNEGRAGRDILWLGTGATGYWNYWSLVTGVTG